MRLIRWITPATTLALAALAQGQDYKIAPMKDAPPSDTAAEVRASLEPAGYRVTDADGKAYAEIWLRKAVPASGRPDGAKDTTQFPVLAEGELLGLLRYPGEGNDYRDQPIAAGSYTLRYGLQPVNGAHVGVSLYRDYALLVPAAADTKAERLAAKPLEEKSAEAAGTAHPAILMLLSPPRGTAADAPAALVHDAEANTWGAILPLSLAVAGGDAPLKLPVRLIVVGAAME